MTGSQTLVGSSDNTFTYTLNEGTKAGNYVITLVLGTLTVTEPTDDNQVVNKAHEAVENGYGLNETVTFTITVKNIYDKTMTITIEELEGVTFVNGKNVIVFEDVEPGKVITTTATYTITEADILAGEFINTVKAKFEGKTYTDTDTVETEDKNGHLTIDKTTTSKPANGEAYALGETIKYEITVTNDGNLTITDIVVTDELTDDEWEIDSLAPGAFQKFETEYVVTEADILAGKVVNVATGTGKSPDPDTPNVPVDPDEEEDDTEDLKTELSVVKTSDLAADEIAKPDQVITYTITVTNKGNVSYKNLVVDDVISNGGEVTITKAEISDGSVATIDGQSVKAAVLPVGATLTITATHVVTAEDAIAGEVANHVVAKGDEIPDPKDPEDPKTPEGEDGVDNNAETWKMTIQANDNLGIAYDGEYHGENGYTVVEGIQEGHSVAQLSYVYAGGEAQGRKDVNAAAEDYIYADEINIAEGSVKIVDADGNDQTAKYSITLLPGDLQILPRQISIKVPDVTMYSGESIDMYLEEILPQVTVENLLESDAMDAAGMAISFNRSLEDGIFEGDGKKAYHPTKSYATSLLGINQPGKIYVRDAKDAVTNADILSVDFASMRIMCGDVDVTSNYQPVIDAGDLTVKTITLKVVYKLYDNGKTNKRISTDTPIKYLSVGDTFTKWCHDITGYTVLNQNTFKPADSAHKTSDTIVAPEMGDNELVLYYGLPLTHYTIRYIYLDGPEYNHSETIAASAGQVISDIGSKIVKNTIEGYSYLRTEGLTLVVPADGSGVITVYYGEATTEEILTNIDDLEVPTGASLGALNVGDCCE